MRILVYPHSMEIGGSQLNAVELAAAVRDRGHDVLVYSEEGPLLDRVDALGLEHIARRGSRISPGPATARHLAGIMRTFEVDVVHGYEWPPILECFAAARGRTRPVGTIMSMGVAPFIPSHLPLVVGTRRIQQHVAARRRAPVHLIEPPVDTELNQPGVTGPGFACDLSGATDVAQVVLVSRLASELKREGILTAVRVVGQLARRRPVRLVVVGDGPCYAEVAAEAAVANAGLSEPAVILTGLLTDPRPAYDSATVALAMGGSALRALAFAKPLVVQGEGGFFETLTPQSVDQFLDGGWYGRDSLSPTQAAARLSHQLEALLDDAPLRDELGEYGRRLVCDRFSLRHAASRQEAIYEAALAAPRAPMRVASDAAASGTRLVAYKARRRWERIRGRAVCDDFNAVPLTHESRRGDAAR